MEVSAKTRSGLGKWLGLVTAVWVQCISRNKHSFSNYSDELKSLMGLTQLELNFLSVAKDVGMAFGLLAGLVFRSLPTPLILLIGALEGLISYGAQWLVVRQSIAPLPYCQMWTFLFTGGMSTAWMSTAVLATSKRNFKRHGRPVSWILKDYRHLSTAIFTDVCSALFSDDPTSVLLMLAVVPAVPAVVCSTAMLFLDESPADAAGAGDDDTDAKYFGAIKAMAVVIAVYLLVFDLTGDHGTAMSRAFVAVLLVLLAAPAAVPIYVVFKARSKNPNVEEGQSKERLLKKEVKEEPAAEENHTIREPETVDFWILFISLFCGVGMGLVVMNNMEQMGLALGYTDVSKFVSMISIFDFFGRIGSRSISKCFLEKTATPRPVWNAASHVLMAVGYVVMALALPGSLYIGSIVVGLCYGVRIAVTVLTASELFDLKYRSLLFILNPPLGSFLFSGLARLLYDSQATKTAGGGKTCVGAHCYGLVFVIMAFACLIGFGLDVLLALRTRKVYLNIHEKLTMMSDMDESGENDENDTEGWEDILDLFDLIS